MSMCFFVFFAFLAGFSAALWMFVHPRAKLLLLEAHLIESHVIPKDDMQEAPQAIPCPTGAKVIILGGQSNAANQDGSRGSYPSSVVNFYRGQCYRAADPLLGASGSQGSVWSRVAWREPTILVPVAVGQTRISEWTPGGALWPRILAALSELKEAHLQPDAVWWHQGESDAMVGVAPDAYALSVTQLVRAMHEKGIGRVVMATASRCMNVKSDALISAQKRSIEASGAILGPNTDVLDDNFRRDGCHFNDAGMKRVAEMWQGYL